MYFADEIRDSGDLKPSRARLSKDELEMAAALIDRFKGTFDPSKYEDTYTGKLLDVIKRKAKGETVSVETEAPAEEETPDLMAALRASIEARSSRSKPRKRSSPRRGGARSRARR